MSTKYTELSKELTEQLVNKDLEKFCRKNINIINNLFNYNQDSFRSFFTALFVMYLKKRVKQVKVIYFPIFEPVKKLKIFKTCDYYLKGLTLFVNGYPIVFETLIFKMKIGRKK